MIGAVLCTLAALSLPVRAHAQTYTLVPSTGHPTQRTLTTSGNGEVKVAPDYVTFSVGVRVQDMVLSKATTEEAARTKAIVAALEKQGIEARHIQTDRISIEPVYTTHENLERLDCYRVQRMAVVRLEDPKKFDQVLQAVLAAGANTIDNISLNTKDLRTHRDTARSLAVKHAREKATAIAKDLGCKLGPPITVSENSWGGSYYYGNNLNTNRYNAQSQSIQSNSSDSSGASESSPAAFAAGTLSITATISVVFEIIPE